LSSAWRSTARARQHGVGLRELSPQLANLLDRSGKRGRVSLDAGPCGRDARGGLLRVLERAVARCGKIGVALVLLLGEDLVGLVGRDGCLRRLDDGLLRLKGRLLALDQSQRGADIGLGLVERDSIVPVVDAGEDLTRLHPLVVADKHRGEIARHLRRDGDVVGLNVGVVCRDVEASDRPVIPSKGEPDREASHGGTRQQHPAQAAFASL
jgi:hypothetical protein